MFIKDQTKTKEHKQELIRKSKQTKSKQANKKDDQSKEIKKLKKQNEQFISKNNKLLHKISQLEKEKAQLSNRIKDKNTAIKSLKKEVLEKEKELFQLNQLLAQLNQKATLDMKQLNEIISEQNDKNLRLESEIEALKEEEMHKEINKYKSIINNMEQLLYAKEKKVEHFRGKYVKIHNEKQTLENKIAKLDKQINLYIQNEHNFQKELERIKLNTLEEMGIEKIIDFLFNKMKLKNIQNYRYVNKLNNKYDYLTKYKRQLDQKLSSDIKNLSDWQEKFGFIEQDNKEEWWFIDLENHSYSIIASLPKKLNNDLPAKAVIKEGSAFLLYVWDKDNEIPEEITKNLKRIQEDENVNVEDEYEYIGKFSVTIITSLNGNKYKRRLEKHGINAIWIDSFEKSPSHVREIMENSDIVIMYPDSMPHYILDFIEDRNSPKYQFMKNNNEDSLLIRTRFAAAQLGLI